MSISTLDSEQIEVTAVVRVDDGRRIVRVVDSTADQYLLDLSPDQAKELAVALIAASERLGGLLAIPGGAS